MNFKVTPENFITEWVKALRSDEYQKGTGYLRVNADDGVARFCCLGVLCEVAGLQTMGDNGTPVYVDDLGSSSNTRLPYGFAEYLGIHEAGKLREEISPTRNRIFDSLIDINDEAGLTFAEIADIIEREWAKGNISKPSSL